MTLGIDSYSAGISLMRACGNPEQLNIARNLRIIMEFYTLKA